MNGDFHKLAHPLLIEPCEGIVLPYFVCQIGRKELARIVPADTEYSLSQVVGPEREKFSLHGDFIGGQRPARDFDHRPDVVFDFDSILLHNLAEQRLPRHPSDF